ncbi:hypothetical protein Taro_017023 [Colocasia esculenta]|uniref:Protein kinase domain-containing protein n=1 Tax=Colocasia esculenta TaxID=4460 RepID=A0A843UF84_COLES|nr:hypothetical protein [Colocasia esculenta]
MTCISRRSHLQTSPALVLDRFTGQSHTTASRGGLHRVLQEVGIGNGDKWGGGGGDAMEGGGFLAVPALSLASLWTPFHQADIPTVESSDRIFSSPAPPCQSWWGFPIRDVGSEIPPPGYFLKEVDSPAHQNLERLGLALLLPIGRTIGEGIFIKVKVAVDTETRQSIAIKILDRKMVLENKLMQQGSGPFAPCSYYDSGGIHLRPPLATLLLVIATTAKLLFEVLALPLYQSGLQKPPPSLGCPLLPPPALPRPQKACSEVHFSLPPQPSPPPFSPCPSTCVTVHCAHGAIATPGLPITPIPQPVRHTQSLAHRV